MSDIFSRGEKATLSSITEVCHGLREGMDLILNVTVYSFNLPGKEGVARLDVVGRRRREPANIQRLY